MTSQQPTDPRVETVGESREPAWVSAIDKLTRVGVGIGGVVVAIIALEIVVDVISRNFFNHPIPGTLEMVALWWMPVIAYMAIGYAQFHDEQIRVTLLLEKARPSHVRILDLVQEFVSGLMVIWMIYLATIQTIRSYQIQEAGIVNAWLLYWPGRAAVALGLVITLAAIVGRIAILLRSRGVAFDELGVSREVADEELVTTTTHAEEAR